MVADAAGGLETPLKAIQMKILFIAAPKHRRRINCIYAPISPFRGIVTSLDGVAIN